MHQPTDPGGFPDCTRCGHPFEAHVRPEGKGPNGEGLPWPCRMCECPGFVVSRTLTEDVKHTSSLRIISAVEDLRAREFTRELIEELLVAIVADVFDKPPPDSEP